MCQCTTRGICAVTRIRTVEPTTPPGASTLTAAFRMIGCPWSADRAAAVASQGVQPWLVDPIRAPFRAAFSTMDSPYRYNPNCTIPRNMMMAVVTTKVNSTELCPRSFLLIMDCLLNKCQRFLQTAGRHILPAAHQAGDALEQGDQGVPEDGDHDQHGNDQADQDNNEFRIDKTVKELIQWCISLCIYLTGYIIILCREKTFGYHLVWS